MKGFAEKHVELHCVNFFDAIRLFLSKTRWFGETLFKWKSEEPWPVETLFHCYPYEEQFRDAKRTRETGEALSQIYFGVCNQSNWDKDLDHWQNRKSPPSRIVRTIKRRRMRRLV